MIGFFMTVSAIHFTISVQKVNLRYKPRFAMLTELKINMTTYNKLKIAILTIFASQNINAINVDPVIIQSNAGELLYAELNFRQSDLNTPIEVSLAKPEDLISIGATHQPPGHLNFFTRRNPNGTGVITITSSRPITNPELNIIVKIKEGSTTRLQQIKKPLTRNTSAYNKTTNKENALAPVMIVNEQDIALNLPTSSVYPPSPTTLNPSSKAPPPMMPAQQTKSSNTSTTAPIVLQTATPVAVSASPVQSTPIQATSTVTEKETPVKAVVPENNVIKQPVNQPPQIAPVIAQKSVSTDPLAKKYAEEQIAKKSEKASDTLKHEVPKTKVADAVKIEPQKITTPHNEKHVVKSNESLWAIASKIANQQNKSVGAVMQQIKANNEHAFIHGDANRLKRGVTLNLEESSKNENVKKAAKNPKKQLMKKQSGVAKYKLSQAEMNLVAENEQNSAHGSAPKSINSNKTSQELSSKVMTYREKTVKLQRNVTQLEIALNQKDHRIQLLNARLAQLQQQLKKQQAEKKPNS